MWFIFTSDIVQQVEKTGEMGYMAVVFAFNFFGSIAALAMNYDGMSQDRESKFLDLILTSGVSKKMVFISKVFNSLFVSGVFALLYTSVLTIVHTILSGHIGTGILVWRYALPITLFLSIFSLMGLMLSVIFRSSKTSLITSVIIGALMMPQLFVLMMDGLSKALKFGGRTTEVLYMISPAITMNALNGYSETYLAVWATVIVAIYLAGIIIIGGKVFIFQDELNYGE